MQEQLNELVQSSEEFKEGRPGGFRNVSLESRFYAAFQIFTVLMYFKHGTMALAALLSFIPAAILTVADLEASKIPQHKRPRHRSSEFWLTYWMLFGIISMAEQTAQISEKNPGYPLIKMAFFLWCIHPETRGTRRILRQIRRWSKMIKPELDQDVVVGDVPG
mmetsp:Transcript_33349/g.62002  ORF Transcript_33349/g.62002 Transcript_33349/m.62002 type:complete len:163 (+) Transcript_33349:867-1355(+)